MRVAHSWPPQILLAHHAVSTMEFDETASSYTTEASELKTRLLLEHRQQLTDDLAESPYDLILYLQRALVYSKLSYFDLAAGDAYRALLLTDEVRNDGFEYHEQALAALGSYSSSPDTLPEVLRHGALGKDSSDMVNGYGPRGPGSEQELAAIASVRCYQMLAISLCLCGCHKSAYEHVERGLAASPNNQELLHYKNTILQLARQKQKVDELDIDDLKDDGLARREVYPWNSYEPDRFSNQTLAALNKELACMAPKCAVKVSKLPTLLLEASNTDGYDIIPTNNQLGLFATEDIAPGETVLNEYSLLTANNRHKESTCDACGSQLPPLSAEGGPVSCSDCCDTVFCDDFCHDKAQQAYHPAVCDMDVDSIAKDPEASEGPAALFLLLLARVLAMSVHQGVHPLEVREIKYIWGDFLTTETNAVSSDPNAMEPPPTWTLPFSFKYNIQTPLHILEKMDIDIFKTLPNHDNWVFNTCYAKFRGTASARQNPRNGRPEVAAVHPFWCLANHDCNPNVTWEWGGRMKLWARDRRVVGDMPGGIKAGEEILNHYCDLSLSVKDRRAWAKGSLGGLCMCKRCRDELKDGESNKNGSTPTMEDQRMDG